MKAKGNGVSVRNAMLADELSEDGAEPVEIEQPESGGYVADVAPVTAQPLPAGFDMAAFAALLANAMGQSGQATAEAIKTGLAEATTMAREPIPENKVAPGFSVYSQPEGDRAKPRTKLHCPMFLGVFDSETGRTDAAFEIFEDTCTEEERRMLNQLVPGSFLVERNDGATANVVVAARKDDRGVINRQIIGFPTMWLSKDEQAQMPSQKKILQQLTSAA